MLIIDTLTTGLEKILRWHQKFYNNFISEIILGIGCGDLLLGQLSDEIVN
jgi:hypothetical protein